MEKTKTGRGFTLYTFKDSNGVECTVQQSSSAMESKIWVGAKELDLQHFKAGEGWEKIDLIDTIQEHYVANNRMHLNREQAIELRNVLDSFIENGEI